MMKKSLIQSMLALAICSGVASAQTVGLFDKQADWGPRTTYKAVGSATISGGVYTLQGNGDDIWNNDDEAFFLYTEKTGDWTVTGKVQWVDHGADDWAKIGVMIREKPTAANSRHFSAMLRGAGNGDGSYAQYRVNEGGSSSSADIRTSDNLAVNDTGDGVWLRVTRVTSQNLYVAEYSLDGTTWNIGHAALLSGWTENAAYGLAITNHLDNELLAEGTASNVSITAANFTKPLSFRSFSTPSVKPGSAMDVTIKIANPSGTLTETLPSGWTASDISNGGSVSNGVITWTLAADVTEVKYTVTAPANAAVPAFSGQTTAFNTFGATTVGIVAPGVGVFDSQVDVGDVGLAGSAEFTDNYYTVNGSGGDIWDAADAFHYVYKEMSGSFSVKGNLFVVADGGDTTWAKAGLMLRDSLDAGSVNAFLLVRSSDQRMIGQWRSTAGGGSSNVGDAEANNDHNGDMEIVRLGDTVNFYRYNQAGDKVLVGTTSLPELTDPIYMGIAVTSHSRGNNSWAEVMDLQVTPYDLTAARTVSSQGIPKSGSTVTVTVTANVTAGKTNSGKITEVLPAGYTINNIQASNGATTQSGNNLVWTLSSLSGQAILTYEIVVPADLKAVVPISGTVDNGLTVTGPNQLLPVNFEVPFKATAPVLDGVLSAGEWDEAYSAKFTHAEGDATAPGVHISGNAYPETDEFGTVYIMHSADAIYVAVDVVDKILVDFDGNATDTWQNDSAEIYIDGNLSRSNPFEETRFGFQASIVGDGHFVAGTNAPTPVALSNGGYASTNGAYWNYGAKAKATDDGYVVEFKADKAQVLDPANRAVIGFDVMMNSGEATGERTGKWAFWNTLADGTNTDVDGVVQEYWNNEQGKAVVELVGGPQSVFDWSTF